MEQTKKSKLTRIVLDNLNKPIAIYGLFIGAMLESIILIIPVEIMMLTVMLGSKSHSMKKIVTVSVLGSVLGGVCGYLIGCLAWESIGIIILEDFLSFQFTYNNTSKDILLPGYITQTLGSLLPSNYLFEVYDHYSGWIVALFAFTPLPYKLIAITSGASKSSFMVFFIASLLSRALRFSIVGYLIFRYRSDVMNWIRKLDRYLIAIILIAVAIIFAVIILN